MPTELERLASVETTLTEHGKKLDKMDEKMDVLIAAHYKQQGKARVVGIIWSGVIAVAGLVTGWKAGH